MDAETFDLVDGMLAGQGYHDDRQAAVDMLEVGVKAGTLVDVASVVARRYALRTEVIMDWYTEVLTRRIEKLEEQTEGNVGSE